MPCNARLTKTEVILIGDNTMSELLVIGYDDAKTANDARAALLALSKDYALQVGDAVVATRDENGQIKLDQLVNLWTIGAASGSFWGLIAGFLFFMPLLGVVTGAAAGALTGALTDYGIRDDFMKDVAGVLQPGQAALFVLADRVSSDRVLEGIGKFGGRIIRTNLDRSQEDKVRAALEHAVATHPDNQAAPAPDATPEPPPAAA
jgi:uncharacterized membrane protein